MKNLIFKTKISLIYFLFTAFFLFILSFSNTVYGQSEIIQTLSNPATYLDQSDLDKYKKYAESPITDRITLIKFGKIEDFQVNGVITLNIPGYNRPINMRAERVEYQNENNYVWQGKQIISDSIVLPGHLLLVKEGDNLVGEIAFDHDFYIISSVSKDEQVLIKTKVLEPKSDDSDHDATNSSSSEIPCVMGTERCVTDILIMYTEECLALYPNIAMHGRRCFEQMQAAMIRSGINQRTRLVGVMKYPGAWVNQEASGEGVVLEVLLGNPLSAVSQIKYSLDADLLVLMTSGEKHDTTIGKAAKLPADSFANGSAVVNVNYALAGSYVYSHEVGHLFGGHHQNDPSDLPARAHEFDAVYNSNTYHYLTIMHVGTDQILNYSNPDINYLGEPTGTVDRNNACKMQGYGCSVSEILPSDECRISLAGKPGCDNVTITASLKKDDGTICTEVAYWSFDYSYDGVTYVNGQLSTSTTATIPFLGACEPTVFVRIRAYDINQVSITISFEWYNRSCVCGGPIGPGGGFPKAGKNGMHNFSQIEMSISPNPIKDQLLVSITGLSDNENSLELNIIDQQGKLITTYHYDTISPNYLIDGSNLPIGIYVMEARTSEQTISRQFVKQ